MLERALEWQCRTFRTLSPYLFLDPRFSICRGEFGGGSAWGTMKLRASEGMLGEAEKSTSCSLQFPPPGQPHYPGPTVISLRKPGSWRKLGTANSEGEPRSISSRCVAHTWSGDIEAKSGKSQHADLLGQCVPGWAL